MPELSDISALINDYVGDDAAKARDVAQHLRATAPAVSQVLINAGTGIGKGEANGKLAEAQRQAATLTVELDNAKARLAELEAAKPDVARIIAETQAPLQRKARDLEQQLEQARGALHKTLRDQVMEMAVNQATTEGDVLPVYGDVIRARYADRIVIGEDGAPRLLQLGGQDAYDAPDGSIKSAVRQFVRDVARETPAEFRRARGESGAGVDPRPAGGGTVATTRQRLMDAKRTDPRFSGIV
jgi:hypothetical protein